MKLRALALLAPLAACAAEPTARTASAPSGPGWRGSSFVADVDPRAGTFELRATTRTAAAAIEPATVVQDGVPFEGPAGSVELYTESARADLTGADCGFPSSFCATVNLGNYYQGRLDRAIAVIDAISPAAGHSGLNGDPPAFGLDATLGLFDYGAIELGGFGQKTWVFGDDGTAYRIFGTVWAELPATVPGPFGYTGGAVAFGFDDVSATGTPLALGDDEISSAIPIGFAFDFFGASVTELRVGTNGLLYLDPTETDPGCCAGEAIPSATGPNGIIAGYWEDLAATTVRYQTLGVAPSRRFVVEWPAAQHFGEAETATFEIVLFEDGSDVEIRFASATSDGGEHSVGVERADGFDGLSLGFGDLSYASQAFRITHP